MNKKQEVQELAELRDEIAGVIANNVLLRHPVFAPNFYGLTDEILKLIFNSL